MPSPQRSKNMAAIHSKDTKPEKLVRHFLWNHGFRYRINHPRLPGKPDIVMRKYKTCIFINGCFWHGHNVDFSGGIISSSDCCKIPKTNTPFWTAKISRNHQRDQQVVSQLSHMGWHSITIWECQLKPKNFLQTMNALIQTLNTIFLKNHAPRSYDLLPQTQHIAAEDSNTILLKNTSTTGNNDSTNS